MNHSTISYKHFDDAGFTGKKCSIFHINIPHCTRSTTAEVYNTSARSPVYYNQANDPQIVEFTVEFIPFLGGKELIGKADDLVKDVLKDKYEPAPCTICKYDKDDKIELQGTVNDVFIQKVELFLNRSRNINGRNAENSQKEFIRVRFTLIGVEPKLERK